MTTELPAQALFGHSPYPPIGDYGFLSDCETTALVAPSGNVEWMCLPRMDSPSIFGSILDRDAGGFRIGPADQLVHAARLDHRPRRAAHRAVAPHRRAVALAPPRAHRLRRGARAAAHRAVRERRGAGHPGLRAGVRLRAAPRAVAVHRRGLPPG